MTSFQTTRIDCVILTAFDSAFSFLKNTWVFERIRAHQAKSVEQADFLLMATGATVLLSDLAIVDFTWRSALDMIQEHHPLVSMLVMADPPDGPFLKDAFKLGIFGIVWKPIQLDAPKLIRTAHEACRDRHLLREKYQQLASFCLHGNTIRDQ